MIPTPLLRVTSRKGELRPRFVDPEDPGALELAAGVVAMVRAAVDRGARLGELLDELDEAAAAEDDPPLWRGLAHLATAGADADAQPPLEPEPLRAELFRAAAAAGHPGSTDRPDARAFVAGWAAERGLAEADVWASLYADLPSEAVLRSADAPTPEALLHRYNLATVQGVLRSAVELRICLTRPSPPRMRQLFRWMKFHQLLHRARRDGPDLHLVVDGPVSLFQASARYGRSLARFVPALVLHPEPWTLEATVEWTRARTHRTLRISSEDGLVSHLPDDGAWRPKAVEQLARRLADGDVRGWASADGESPVAVGGEVWFPDFRLTGDGRHADVVCLGHWRPDRLAAALQLLDQQGPANVVVVASRKSGVGKGAALPEHPRVVAYADVVPLPALRAAVEQFAR